MHCILLPFLELIYWLKSARSSVYQNMIDRYKANAQNLYEKDFFYYFKLLTNCIENDKSKLINLIIFLIKKKKFNRFWIK